MVTDRIGHEPDGAHQVAATRALHPGGDSAVDFESVRLEPT
jgi:hypothetical protein